MKQADLIKLYSWANHPLILTFAEKFTQKQWQHINDAGLPKLLPAMDPTYIVAFFQGCEGCLSVGLELHVVQAIINSLKTQLQTSPFHLQDVLTWLGPNLSQRVQQDTTSYGMMDDLVQLLSSKALRDRLERPLVSQNTKLNMQSIRELYRLKRISLQEFIDIIRTNAELSQRQFPEWIGEHIEIRVLADQFTDEQLTLLPTLLSNSILSDRELTCSFLRIMLAKTTINDLQKIKDCPVDSFQLIVRSMQDLFLDVATQKIARFDDDLIDNLAHLTSALGLSNHTTLAQTLIKKYVTKYKDSVIPAHEETEALSCAVRNAANAGNYWDLLPLTLLTKTINSAGSPSGRTALHRAVEYANKTGDRLCFDLLANHPDIDFSVEDKDHKTALDLWDFKRFPDAALLKKLNEVNKLKEKPEVKRASPLTVNSVFLPASAVAPAVAPEEENKEKCNIS